MWPLPIRGGLDCEGCHVAELAEGHDIRDGVRASVSTERDNPRPFYSVDRESVAVMSGRRFRADLFKKMRALE